MTCNDTLKYASLKAEPDFRFGQVFLPTFEPFVLNVESNFDLFILLYSVLGKRLGKSMRLIAKEVKEMSQQDILSFEEAGKVTIAGHTLVLTDIKVSLSSYAFLLE